MHKILLSQVKDEDDNVVTTASTDPEALSVSVYTSGEVADVHALHSQLRKLGPDGLAELLVTCGQAAYAHRYDPLLTDEQ